MSVQITEVTQEFINQMDVYRQKTDAGLIEMCSDNVVLFAQHMLGIRLYSWQIDFLTRVSKALKGDYWTKEFAAITSRQIGKSTSVAVFALWCCVFNKAPGGISNSTQVGIVSATDKQATVLLETVNRLMRLGDAYMGDTYKDESGNSLFPVEGNRGGFFSKLLDANKPNNTTTITFKAYKESVHGPYVLKGSKTGSVVKSYPPTPMILGETFGVIVVDEAGMADRVTDKVYYEYVYPTGNKYNAIRISLSTPWVASGFFYRMINPDGTMEEAPVDKVCFTIDAIKIEDPAYAETVMKIVKSLEADGKIDEVRRAYYCQFVKGEASYFDPDKVQTVFTDNLSPMASYAQPCDMGIDFGGQVKSKTVITISELGKDGIINRLYKKVYEVGKDLSLLDDVAALLKDFNIQRIIPDDCPAGDHLIRKMIEENGWNVHPMNFRADKVKKYGAFRTLMNKGKIKSFIDDHMKTEMLALEFGQGSRQSVITPAPGYTDDEIDSFVMSCYFFLNDNTGVKAYDYYKDEQ